MQPNLLAIIDRVSYLLSRYSHSENIHPTPICHTLRAPPANRPSLYYTCSHMDQRSLLLHRRDAQQFPGKFSLHMFQQRNNLKGKARDADARNIPNTEVSVPRKKRSKTPLIPRNVPAKAAPGSRLE